jgi:hypothetical protein
MPLPLAAVSVSAACLATQGHQLDQGARAPSESSRHELQHEPVQQALLVLLQCRRGFHRHHLLYCPTALQCPSETVIVLVVLSDDACVCVCVCVCVTAMVSVVLVVAVLSAMYVYYS